MQAELEDMTEDEDEIPDPPKDIQGEFTPFFVMTNSEGYYEKELDVDMNIFMKAQNCKVLISFLKLKSSDQEILN